MGRRVAVELFLIAAIGLALAALGPFGSYGVPFGPRALLWIGFILTGYAIFRPMTVVRRWLSEATGIGRLPAQLVAIALGGLPLSFLIRFILGALVADFTAPFYETYLQVCGIGLAVTFIMDRLVGGGRKGSDPAPDAAPPPADPQPPRIRFLDRLPPAIGPRLLCLSMEDHYVRAHGMTGSALILMRLRDAIDELDGMPGLQAHRSWWVAADAVERVERDGERMRLRLVNGLSVPVSRSQIGAVRARRWPES